MSDAEKNIIYQPSGLMCATCENKFKDCSNLDFASMRVIGTYSNGDKKVKCSDFKRRSDD